MSTPSLEGLPAELFSNILNDIAFADKLSLSSTNSAFRTLLKPSVNKSIRITTRSWPSSDLLASLAQSAKHLTLAVEANVEADHEGYPEDLDAFYVQRSRARKRGEDPGPEIGEEFASDSSDNRDDKEDSENWTPPIADELRDFLNGTALPGLTSITLDFSPLDFDWHHGHPNNGFYLFGDTDGSIEEPAKTLALEDTLGWRALMRDIWASLALNPSITSLTIAPFIPLPVSTWTTHPWKHFLGRLHTLSIPRLHAADNGAGWCTQTVYGYTYVLAHMGSHFWQHCTSLRSLHLGLMADGNIGGGILEEYSRHAPHSMTPEHMPHLESYSQMGGYVDSQLATFLAARKNTLRSLTLDTVSAASQYEQTDPPCLWSTFFSAIADSRPSKLTTLEILFNDDYTPAAEEGTTAKQHFHAPNYTGKDLRDARKTLGLSEWDGNSGKTLDRVEYANGEERILWLYSSNTDKYGDMWLCGDEVVEKFRDGSDWREYARLQKIVEENRGRK